MEEARRRAIEKDGNKRHSVRFDFQIRIIDYRAILIDSAIPTLSGEQNTVSSFHHFILCEFSKLGIA